MIGIAIAVLLATQLCAVFVPPVVIWTARRLLRRRSHHPGSEHPIISNHAREADPDYPAVEIENQLLADLLHGRLTRAQYRRSVLDLAVAEWTTDADI